AFQRVSPHMVLDQHEWTVADAGANSLEASGGAVADRLARTLARRGTEGGVRLAATTSRSSADSRLAHRHFARLGVPSLLLETVPSVPMATKVSIYRNVMVEAARVAPHAPERARGVRYRAAGPEMFPGKR